MRRSCYNTTIEISGATLVCSGDRSCANSQIIARGESSVSVAGHLGLANSTITVLGGTADVTFSLSAAYSTSNTLIECNGANSICTVNCWAANGCDGLILECGDESNEDSLDGFDLAEFEPR